MWCYSDLRRKIRSTVIITRTPSDCAALRECHTDYSRTPPLKDSVVFNVRRAWHKYEKDSPLRAMKKMKKNRLVEAVKKVKRTRYHMYFGAYRAP